MGVLDCTCVEPWMFPRSPGRKILKFIPETEYLVHSLQTQHFHFGLSLLIFKWTQLQNSFELEDFSFGNTVEGGLCVSKLQRELNLNFQKYSVFCCCCLYFYHVKCLLSKIKYCILQILRLQNSVKFVEICLCDSLLKWDILLNI